MIKRVKVYAEVDETMRTSYEPYIKEIEIPDDINDEKDINDYIYDEIDNCFWDEDLKMINTDWIDAGNIAFKWVELEKNNSEE